MRHGFLGTGETGYHPLRKIRTVISGLRYAVLYDWSVTYKLIVSVVVLAVALGARAWVDFLLILVVNAAQPNAIAKQALARIGELYAIEAQGQDVSIEARAQLRQEQPQPRLAALHAWLIATRRVVADGSGTAKALDYSLKRWPALSRYATAGDRPIDNNPLENDIRPVALGKKLAFHRFRARRKAGCSHSEPALRRQAQRT